MAGVFTNFFLVCALLVFALEQSNAQSTSKDMIAGRDVCGRMMESEMGMRDFPWTALLEFEYRKDKSKIFVCSGALIGSRHVLTTSVCVTEGKHNRLTRVRLGEWNLNRTRDCTEEKMEKSKMCRDEPIDVDVEEVMRYPMFTDKGKDQFKNDLAIIRLARDVEYTDYIRPICLPRIEDETKAGSMIESITWGRTTGRPLRKQRLTMTVVDNTECHAKYLTSKLDITKSQICALEVHGMETRAGDGGAPLMNRFKDNQDLWYLEGLLSFGPTESSTGYPDVFTRVADYLEWIRMTVNKS